MIRGVVGVIGLLSVLVPNRMLNLFEWLVIENSEDSTPKSWVSPAIRFEGLVITLVCLLKGRPYAWMMNLTGAFGAIVLFVPDLYRKLATTFLYENPEHVQWNNRFTTVIRLIGGLYALLALWSFANRRSEE